METLDNIMSRRGEAMPSAETKETETQTPVAQPNEGESPQKETTEPGQQQEPTPDGQPKTVPHQALEAERQKSKRYTEEVADLRREIASRDAAWERRIGQLLEAQKPQQAPPDFYENPQAAVFHTVQPHFEQFSRAMQVNNQLVAAARYGDDKVKEADQAFAEAYQSQRLDPADYQRVMSSPNIFAAAVQWNEQRKLREEIGDDPSAYREKIRAQVLSELQQQNGNGAAQANGQQKPAPVMPSNFAAARNVGNRSGPAWAGPPSIADIFERRRNPQQ